MQDKGEELPELPAEIRNKIYDLMLNDYRTDAPLAYHLREGKPTPYSAPPLACTCRRIRKELHPMVHALDPGKPSRLICVVENFGFDWVGPFVDGVRRRAQRKNSIHIEDQGGSSSKNARKGVDERKFCEEQPDVRITLVFGGNFDTIGNCQSVLRWLDRRTAEQGSSRYTGT